MDTFEKIARLRELMRERKLDAYIVPDNDPHMSEYTADHWKIREWLSGFTGSSGTLVVTSDAAALWTDGRYFIQAESQLKGSEIRLMKLGLPDTVDYISWIKSAVRESANIGCNGKLISAHDYLDIAKKLKDKKCNLLTEYRLPETLWEEEGRPGLPEAPAFSY